MLRALLDAWKDDLRYRVSRVKARLKFMVDDYGPEGMRAEVEQRLGRKLADFELPPLDGELGDHIGVHAAAAARALLHRRAGPPRARHRRPAASPSPTSPRALGGDVRAHAPAELRRSRTCPSARSTRWSRALARDRLPARRQPRCAATSIACTGEPHCNFSVTETKRGSTRSSQRLEERFGDDVAGLRLHLDGCPHACAQHWVGDIGFQGTTARDEAGAAPPGVRHLPARRARPAARRSGGRSSGACRPRSSTRRVEGLVGGWLDGARGRRETSARSATGTSDDELGRPGRARARAEHEREEAAACMIELLDELEAGELSVEFEGAEPQELLEWALERFSPRIALSTAFQIDGVALLDMAYELDPSIRVFTVDTGRLPARDVRADRAAARPLPGAASSSCSRPNARAGRSAMVGRHGPNLFYRQVEQRLLCCNVRKVQPLDAAPRRRSTPGSPACAATSGRAAPTSARSRSTTTTARS